MEVNWNAIEAYFRLYSRSIYRGIPSYLCFALLLVAVVGIVLIVTNQKVEHKWRAFGQLVFWEYVAFILCMTVFFREGVEERAFNLMPFWSYTAESADLQHSLYVEGLMNVLMFVPFGLLIGCAYRSIGWKRMLASTVGLTLLIEVLQFIYKRGFAELDDVMHNTLGAVIGLGIITLTVKGFRFHVSGFKYWSIRSKSKENY